MKKTTFLLLTTLCFAGTLSAQVLQNPWKKVTFLGYGQAGYYSVFNQNGPDQHSFKLNKSELSVLGQIDDHWDMMMSFNVSGPAFVKDLFMRYTVSPAFSVKLGQFKTLYGLENNIAPFLNPLIDGSSAPTLYFAGIAGDPHYSGTTGREMGLQISGTVLDSLLTYNIAVMNGQGVNKLSQIRPRMFGASLDLMPLEELRIHSSYIGGRHVALDDPKLSYARHRASMGLELKVPRITARAEYLWGKDADKVSRGGYLQGVIPLQRRYEVVLQGDYLHIPHYGNDALKLATATLGLQHWFSGLCRWQVEYQYRAPITDTGFLGFRDRGHRLQTQVQFLF